MSTASISLPAASSLGVVRNVRIFLTEARYEFVRLLRTRGLTTVTKSIGIISTRCAGSAAITQPP